MPFKLWLLPIEEMKLKLKQTISQTHFETANFGHFSGVVGKIRCHKSQHQSGMN